MILLTSLDTYVETFTTNLSISMFGVIFWCLTCVWWPTIKRSTGSR